MLCLRIRRELLAASAQGFATALSGAQARAAGLPLTSADDQLLDDLSRRCFHYFWEQSDPHAGIARHRARADGSRHPSEGQYVGSTGATGFALSALCIGVPPPERGAVRARATPVRWPSLHRAARAPKMGKWRRLGDSRSSSWRILLSVVWLQLKSPIGRCSIY